MTTRTSFIDAAITEISAGQSRFAPLAALIQQQDHESPANRMAMTHVFLNYRRQEDKKAGLEYGGIKPESLLSFTQTLMNKVCWQSRKMSMSQTEQDEKDIINGIDFTQDLADELNIDRFEAEHIKPLVDDDYATLMAVNSWLGMKMNYLDNIEPLYYYQDRVRLDDGTWEVASNADSYDEAMLVIDSVIERLNEQSAESEYKQAANMSFK